MHALAQRAPAVTEPLLDALEPDDVDAASLGRSTIADEKVLEIVEKGRLARTFEHGHSIALRLRRDSPDHRGIWRAEEPSHGCSDPTENAFHLILS
jgi:hypothetical protein